MLADLGNDTVELGRSRGTVLELPLVHTPDESEVLAYLGNDTVVPRRSPGTVLRLPLVHTPGESEVLADPI